VRKSNGRIEPVAEKLYIVQQIHWQYDDQWFVTEYDTALKAFTTYERAEAYRLELEREARRELVAIPVGEGWWSADLGMTFGGWSEMSSLTEEELTQRVADLGLPPLPDEDEIEMMGVAPDDDRDYAPDSAPLWWKNSWETLGEARADELWNLFDKIRFFEIESVWVGD
jgi:hypothetical protein